MILFHINIFNFLYKVKIFFRNISGISLQEKSETLLSKRTKIDEKRLYDKVFCCKKSFDSGSSSIN